MAKASAPATETEVTLADPDSVMFPPDVFGDDRLTLPEGITFDVWSAIGVNLQRMGRSVNWWVGDWLAYGEHVWADRIYQAVEFSGMDESTVANWMFTSQRIAPEDRRPLSWSHHQAAADLPDLKQRLEVLDYAFTHNLTRAQLRAYIKQLTSIETDAIEATADDDEPKNRIRHTMILSMPKGNRRDMDEIVESLRVWVKDELAARHLDDGGVTVTHSDK